MALTDAELEKLLGDLESDRVERKESIQGDAPTKIREALCAFANDLPDHRRPGVVIVGARDDGRPAGLTVTDELLLQLADMRTDGNILPPPSLVVEKRTLRGAELAVVTVEPADSPPVRYRGRIYIRIGPRRATATAQDERLLNEKRRHRDRPFDVQRVPSANVGDLDRSFFEDSYLPAVVAADVLAANERSYEQRLSATKMIAGTDDPTPTNLGVLVLGIRTRDFLPGAYLQFLRLAGTTLGASIVDEQAIDGSLPEVIRRIDEKLVAHNRVEVDVTSGPIETRRAAYPMAALQQLLRNALLHRTYEASNAPVRVTWYDDRIEIWNPGGPFGAVTPENFGQPGVADYRNPNLAEAVRALGYVQRFGVGIALARAALKANGNPAPAFEANAAYVAVTVRAIA